jgi:NhaA family Na+:H+ antiporter
MPSLERLPNEPADRFTQLFARFLRIETAAGAVLLLCATVAWLASNSVWSSSYLAFWETPLGVTWGDMSFSRSIKRWIDDGAMTLFFFVVALELKREMVFGDLGRPRTAAFSLAAALGGMLVPASIFVLLLGDDVAAHGWGIVMATDTAFVIGCLALLGTRIPPALRAFLLALAIFDDIGAILVIAVGYGSGMNWCALGAAGAALVVIAVAARLGIRQVAFYTGLGILVWVGFDLSGVHATLSGVILGLMTPARSWVSDHRLQAILAKVAAYPSGNQWSGDTQDRRDLRRVGVAAREALSPLERIELALHPWVGFVVLPLFALANAGVVLTPSQMHHPVVIAVTLGLFVGKPLGVVSFIYMATRLRLAVRPPSLTWPLLVGGGLLTGIGFTMALLIAELALEPNRLDSAKFGILCASVLSAASGLALLTWLTRAQSRH